jgi:hypothetical protein
MQTLLILRQPNSQLGITFVGSNTRTLYRSVPVDCICNVDDTDAAAFLSNGLAALGIPSGGTTGQVLTKNSNSDADASWEALPAAASLDHAIIVGAAAGNHTVTGIATTNTLLEVIYYPGAGIAVTDVIDLTGEFTISAANTINNTGGTNTTGGKLIVRWHT